MEENNNNEDVKSAVEEKFVPAYQKSNVEDKNKGKKAKKEKNIKKEKINVGNKKKVFKSKITLIIIVLVILAVALLGYTLIKKTTGNVSDYDRLMENYGFTSLYNSNSDKLIKSEAVKIVVASSLNVNDITNNMFEYKEAEELEYPNQNWIDYAISVGMISENEITTQNQDENISYVEVLRYLSSAKANILGKTLDIEEKVDYKDYEGYTTEQKWAISDAVHNGVLDNSKTRLNGNKDITKSKFNELIIRYVQNYNLLTLEGDKINIKQEKMPSNKNLYPYTLANVDKSIYEIDFAKVNDDFKTPLEVYSELKTNYNKINEIITSYVENIFNIDYENIELQTYKDTMYKISMYKISSSSLDNYLKYVKDNKIKITSEQEVILPVIYFDGENYRARVQIKYNVESAIKLNDLIYGDNEKEYTLGNKTIYLDVPFKINSNYNYVYLSNIDSSVLDNISGKVKLSK